MRPPFGCTLNWYTTVCPARNVGSASGETAVGVLLWWQQHALPNLGIPAAVELSNCLSV